MSNAAQLLSMRDQIEMRDPVMSLLKIWQVCTFFGKLGGHWYVISVCSICVVSIVYFDLWNISNEYYVGAGL